MAIVPNNTPTIEISVIIFTIFFLLIENKYLNAI
tara:strand:+ start:480 stop:581 length:102 start_codon:yes stop_codon:yes gene_type:complete